MQCCCPKLLIIKCSYRSVFFTKTSYQNGMMKLCSRMISQKIGVCVESTDIAHVELKCLSPNDSSFTKSIFVRFHQVGLRMKIFDNRKQAEVNKIFMEEWLTDTRAKILKKCKKLMMQRLIENTKTKDGDIIVIYRDKDSKDLQR